MAEAIAIEGGAFSANDSLLTTCGQAMAAAETFAQEARQTVAGNLAPSGRVDPAVRGQWGPLRLGEVEALPERHAQVPELELLVPTTSEDCCGSAGIYNLVEPHLAGAHPEELAVGLGELEVGIVEHRSAAVVDLHRVST